MRNIVLKRGAQKWIWGSRECCHQIFWTAKPFLVFFSGFQLGKGTAFGAWREKAAPPHGNKRNLFPSLPPVSFSIRGTEEGRRRRQGRTLAFAQQRGENKEKGRISRSIYARRCDIILSSILKKRPQDIETALLIDTAPPPIPPPLSPSLSTSQFQSKARQRVEFTHLNF